MELCPFCGDEFATGEQRGEHLGAEHGQAMADVFEEAARQTYRRRNISHDSATVLVFGLSLLLALVGTVVRGTRFGRRFTARGAK